MYKKNLHVVDCDEFTRKYFENYRKYITCGVMITSNSPVEGNWMKTIDVDRLKQDFYLRKKEKTDVLYGRGLLHADLSDSDYLEKLDEIEKDNERKRRWQN